MRGCYTNSYTCAEPDSKHQPHAHRHGNGYPDTHRNPRRYAHGNAISHGSAGSYGEAAPHAATSSWRLVVAA